MKKHTGYVDATTKYRINFDADEVFSDMIYPCLTREGFWDKLIVTCPDSVQSFCNWIDEYKQAVLWNQLFNSDSDYQNADGKNAQAPKLHDLPFPLQYGILCEYFSDLVIDKYVGGGFACPRYYIGKIESTVDEIITFFMEHQRIIDSPAFGKKNIWPK